LFVCGDVEGFDCWVWHLLHGGVGVCVRVGVAVREVTKKKGKRKRKRKVGMKEEQIKFMKAIV